MLREFRLDVLIVPHGTDGEPHALGLAARVQQQAVAQHMMAEERRCVVEEDEIETIARHAVAAQRDDETPKGLLDAFRVRHEGVVHQHPNVDVAPRTLPTASPAAKQVGNPHFLDCPSPG